MPDTTSAVHSRRSFLHGAAIGVGGLALLGPSASAQAPDLAKRLKVPGRLVLNARRRGPDGTPSSEVLTWNVSETAIIVCDMWDQHWCAGASRRVGVLVPKMNAVLDAARSRGAFIVHAPSDTIDFYKDTLPRRRMLQAPAATPPVPIERWCKLDPSREAPLPIDDSNGGCDCDPRCENFKAWSRQHPGLDIAQEDGVSDNGTEIYNYFRQQGIKNLALMGVHANMCVLGRSFGVRQMRQLGFPVVLVRDLTDTMYDPRSAPHVSHARGTELVVEHIERHWCPSVLSADLAAVVDAGPH